MKNPYNDRNDIVVVIPERVFVFVKKKRLLRLFRRLGRAELQIVRRRFSPAEHQQSVVAGHSVCTGHAAQHQYRGNSLVYCTYSVRVMFSQFHL